MFKLKKIIFILFIIIFPASICSAQSFKRNEDNAFKGVVESNMVYEAGKDIGPVKSYNVSFAIWTLMGEPVYDFKFLWDFY